MARVQQTHTFEAKRIRYALGSGAVTLVVGLAAALLLLYPLPMVGWFNRFVWFGGQVRSDLSVGSVCALLTLLIGLPVGIIAYRLYSAEREDLSPTERILERGRSFWIGRVVVSVVITALLTMGVTFAFYMLDTFFTGARIPMIQALLVCTVYAGTLGFGMAYYVSGMGTLSLLRLIGITLVLGLAVSFSIAQDREWWRNSISFLGHDPQSGVFFNLTIISVGLIALTLSRDLLDDLYVITERGRFPQRGFYVLRVGLVLVCVGIVGVGLFPTAITPLSNDLHNISAHGMAILLVLGMLGLRLIAPQIYPSLFVRLSAGFGLLCVAAIAAHFALRWINFVTLELLLFALFGVWIFLFKRYTQDYIRHQDALAVVPVVQPEAVQSGAQSSG